MKQKILISGKIYTGKTTLLNKVIKDVSLPIVGYISKKEENNDITICFPNGEHKMVIGTANNKIYTANVENLNKFAILLKGSLHKDALIIMDEIGIVETASPLFCKTIKDIFLNDYNVIATIKDRDNAYLNEIKSLAKVYDITEENREEVYEEIKNRAE